MDFEEDSHIDEMDTGLCFSAEESKRLNLEPSPGKYVCKICGSDKFYNNPDYCDHVKQCQSDYQTVKEGRIDCECDYFTPTLQPSDFIPKICKYHKIINAEMGEKYSPAMQEAKPKLSDINNNHQIEKAGDQIRQYLQAAIYMSNTKNESFVYSEHILNASRVETMDFVKKYINEREWVRMRYMLAYKE